MEPQINVWHKSDTFKSDVMLYVMDKQIVVCEVVETLPNNLYKVLSEGGFEYLCYLGGKLKYNHIRVIIGDKVEVELDPYKGKTSNRIIKRK